MGVLGRLEDYGVEVITDQANVEAPVFLQYCNTVGTAVLTQNEPTWLAPEHPGSVVWGVI